MILLETEIKIMILLELIKDNLNKEDKKVVLNIDFKKTDEEIIVAMITAKLLNFDSTKYDYQETR